MRGAIYRLTTAAQEAERARIAITVPLGRVMECHCGEIVVVIGSGTRLDTNGGTHLHVIGGS